MKRFALMGGLCLVVIYLALHFVHFATPTQPHKAKQTGPSLTAFMSHVHIQQYNEAGQLVRKLNSPYATTYLENKIKKYTQIKQPRLMLFDAQQGHVNIRAQHGRLTDHDRTLLLKNKVLIQQHRHDQTTPLALSTTELTVFPERQLAQTQALVYISQGSQFSLEARGLTAWLDKNILQLHKPVRGYYVPTPSHPQSHRTHVAAHGGRARHG